MRWRWKTNSPTYNVQRACGIGLEAAWQIALKVHTGSIDIGIAGGADTNSDLPIEVSANFQKILLQLNASKTTVDRLKTLSQLRLKDLVPKTPLIDEPRTKLSMGDHCELMVKEWQISREAQDELALVSHTNGTKAYDSGFYDDLVVPYLGLKRDGTLRGDTSLEKLAKLKPAYDLENGSLTAGNSSSSLSLGHPFAATGARILGTLAKLLSQNKNKRGLISICTAGGMGIAAIVESV